MVPEAVPQAFGVPPLTRSGRILALYFTEADVDDLAKQAGVRPAADPAAVADFLDVVTDAYLVGRAGVARRRSPAKLARDLSIVAAACKKASRRLKDEEANLRHYLNARAVLDTRAPSLLQIDPFGEGPGGRKRVNAAIQVLEDLSRWCESAERLAVARKGTQKRHEGDPGMTRLVEDLMLVWVATWNRPPSISRSNEKPPFVRFVLCYFAILLSRLSAQTLKRDTGLKNALKKVTAIAIRERVEQTKLHQELRARKSPSKIV